MQKVAVFGNAGGGKSTLAKRLAEIVGLPLYVIDIIQYPDGSYRANDLDGGKMSLEVYEKLHDEMLRRDAWIIDGFNNVALAWKRFDVADTLIHVDLPVTTHYWGVTKRLVRGLLANPTGWPKYTPVLESSLASYRVVWRCHPRAPVVFGSHRSANRARSRALPELVRISGSRAQLDLVEATLPEIRNEIAA